MKPVLKFAQSLPIFVRRELATVPDFTFHQWVIGPVRWEYSCEVDVSDVRQFVTEGKLIVIPANPLAIVSHAAALLGVKPSSVIRDGDLWTATAGDMRVVRDGDCGGLMAACTLLHGAMGQSLRGPAPAKASTAPTLTPMTLGWSVKPKTIIQ